MDEINEVVIISEAYPSAADLPDQFIWIHPYDRWNDFGHVSRAIITKIVNKEIVADYHGKAAYLDDRSGKYLGVGSALFSRDAGDFIVTDTRHVFSLADTQEYYRQVIRNLGVDEGTRFLYGTNDLVAISGNSKLKDIDAAARASEVFQFSVTRESEAYYALRNAKPILRGLDQEDISSGPKFIRIEIPDQKGDQVEIEFEFNHDIAIPKRTCVLIGKNGVGKSSALGSIARKAVKGINREARSDDDRIVASRVLAFTPSNEFTGVFPSDKVKRPVTYYKRMSTSRIRHSEGGNTASAAIVELFRNNRRIARKSRFQIFLNAVLAINNPEEIGFRLKSSNEVIQLTTLNRMSEQALIETLRDINQSVEPSRVREATFFHLSTGEVRFIKLLALICMHIENGTLILLDEPETHLHPNFIARLMSALEGLLSDTGSCAVIATHSVYVVREVFHDQVLIVERDEDGRVGVKVPGMRTFGADISSISSFIFAEDGQSFLAADIIDRLCHAHSSFDEIKEKYGEYLSREILSTIKENYR